MTLWGSDTVRDTAESVGVVNLNKDVTSALARDVEFRVALVVEEALKFMRKSKRTVLWTQDISHALRVLDIEPLYGYDSTRILKYGEASLGPGQPLYYVDDEEADLEKLINAPLPKVPRELSFTAHWLAIEGVQPSIPQNPTTSETRGVELLPKSATASTSNINPALASMAGIESTTTTKPLVKHHLSQELILYFERVTTSAASEDQPELRTAALASLREDPGLSQLLPYFIHYAADRVTHSLSHIPTLLTTLSIIDALSHNPHLNLSPYISALVPIILTCLTARHIGSPPDPSSITSTTQPPEHFHLRRHASSLLAQLSTKYARTSHGLKPRLARSCLKTFLDPKKPLGSHYGAIHGLRAIGGAEVVRKLIVPNLKAFSEVVLADAGESGSVREREVEEVVKAIVEALAVLVDDAEEGGFGEVVVNGVNGHVNRGEDGMLREKLAGRIGEMLAGRILAGGKEGERLAKAVVDEGFDDL